MSYIDKERIQFLLDYCSKHPELYNEVANHLYSRFAIQGAEITLLVTYYVAEERRKHEENIHNCKGE